MAEEKKKTTKKRRASMGVKCIRSKASAQYGCLVPGWKFGGTRQQLSRFRM